MTEAKQVSINRDFIISGSLSAQAFRIAVRVDTTATRLVRLALNDFPSARELEEHIVGALNLFDDTMKAVRKDLTRANRRRREGVPQGMKQSYVVRTIVSAHAFKAAVLVDQIQRDLTMLSLAGSPHIAEITSTSQATVSEALKTLDAAVTFVSKSIDSRADKARNRPAKKGVPSPQKSTKRPPEDPGKETPPSQPQLDQASEHQPSTEKSETIAPDPAGTNKPAEKTAKVPGPSPAKPPKAKVAEPGPKEKDSARDNVTKIDNSSATA